MQTRTCYVVMPFGDIEEKDAKYYFYQSVYDNLIAPAVQRLDFMTINALNDSGTLQIDTAMTRRILNSQLIVADVSEGNPNVYYEVGLAFGSRVPCCLIASSESKGKIPFNLAHMQLFHYPNDPKKFSQTVEALEKFIRKRLSTDAFLPVISMAQPIKITAPTEKLYPLPLASEIPRNLLENMHLEKLAIDNSILLDSFLAFNGISLEKAIVQPRSDARHLPLELMDIVKKESPRLERWGYTNGTIAVLQDIPTLPVTDTKLVLVLAPDKFFNFKAIQENLHEKLVPRKGELITPFKFDEPDILNYINSKIPGMLCFHCIVLTADGFLLLVKRARQQGFYANKWSASFEENMQWDKDCNSDKDECRDAISKCALRAVKEEIKCFPRTQDIKLLGICRDVVISPTFDLLVLVQLRETADEARGALPNALDKNEAAAFDFKFAKSLDSLSSLLMSSIYMPSDEAVFFTSEASRGPHEWHGSSRMRIGALLGHLYGQANLLEVLRTACR